nr:reverse transcriptase domain-containing protein [Tanacetum cinerariifolium]
MKKESAHGNPSLAEMKWLTESLSRPHGIPSQKRRAGEGTLRKGSDPGIPEPGLEAQNQGTTVRNHQGRKIQKEERCSKDWKKVCFIGSETRKRMCLDIQEARSGSYTTVAARTQKAVTKVLTLKKHKLLLRNIAIKESIREERKQCQKAKEVQEGTGSQNQRSKSQVLMMTYPNHGIPGKLPPTEKCIKDPVEIHNIKQRDGESTEEFLRRKLGKRKTSRGERNEQRMKRKQDRFTLITKTPKEILALDKGKFKPPPPMTTLIEKKNASKFSEFHGEVGHTTGECMHLKSKFCSKIKNQLLPANTPLVGFSGEIIWPLGQISLLVKICDEEHSTSALMNFMLVRSPFPYNGIIGRPRVRKIQAIPSRAHGMLKFLVAGEIVTLQSSRIISLECSMVLEPGVSQPIINQKPIDMTGVPRHVAEHRLNVREGCLPVRQKKRGQAPERNKAIGKEVKKSVEAGIMKEVHYHSWLSNSVMVKKHDDNWRISTKEAISAVLMTERDGKQVPIYFVSSALQGPEINYTLMEKLIPALVSASKRLKRTSVKGQILADFIVERPEDDTSDTSTEDREELPDPWILFKDGSSCIDGFEASLIITNPKGMEFTYALRFRLNATNNEVEYETLIAGLQIAGQMGVQNLQVNVDSKLVANQINGVYIAKESSMIKYLEKVKNLASTFKEFFIKQIPRGENKKEDALRKIASTSFAHLNKQVLMEELKEKSLDEKETLAVIEEEGHT